MTNLKITQVNGRIPINCITGIEFEEMLENLEVIRATAAVASLSIKIDAAGKIKISLEDANGDTDEIQMEVD